MTNQEINEAVARKLGFVNDPIFGWVESEKYPDGKKGIPNYCEDISAAWEVVEKCDSISLWTVSGRWRCDMDSEMCKDADTAPMAICLAFLKIQSQEKSC